MEGNGSCDKGEPMGEKLFFLREKRGYPPPYPPFFTPFWRARGQARLPIESESIREERVGVFHLRFFQDGDQSFTNQVWQGR